MTAVVLPGVPFPLEPWGNPPCEDEVADGALALTRGPGSDPVVPPDAGPRPGLPGDRDFTLSARVSVQFRSPSDAGVLLLYLSERRWAKLCYELSPQRRPTAVTGALRALADHR